MDGRSDLYSLGVVGFFALSGRLPFDAPNTAALLALHITQPAPPLATAAPGIPGRLALRERGQQQREELAFESAGSPPLFARVLRKVSIVAFGAAVGSGLMLALFPGRGDPLEMGMSWLLWSIFGISAFTTVTGGLLGFTLAPKDPARHLRTRLWSGRLGEWFARIAMIGTKRKALPAASAHRPTEVAIGLVASALFDALPKEVRKGLPDLPDVLRKLEGDARAMRRRVDELNEALTSQGEQRRWTPRLRGGWRSRRY